MIIFYYMSGLCATLNYIYIYIYIYICIYIYKLYFVNSNTLVVTVSCGTQTGSFATNIDSCASTAGTSKGRNGPKDCWDVCKGGADGDSCNSAFVKGIVWKHGTCGCIMVNYLSLCEVSNRTTDFEYYEPDGENCVFGK